VGHPGFLAADVEHHACEKALFHVIQVPQVKHKLEVHPGPRGSLDRIGPVRKLVHLVDLIRDSKFQFLKIGEGYRLEEPLIHEKVRPGVFRLLCGVPDCLVPNLVLGIVEDGQFAVSVRGYPFHQLGITVRMILGEAVIIELGELQFPRRIGFDDVIYHESVSVQFTNLFSTGIGEVVMQPLLEILGMRLDPDLSQRTIRNQMNLPGRNITIDRHFSDRRTAPPLRIHFHK